MKLYIQYIFILLGYVLSIHCQANTILTIQSVSDNQCVDVPANNYVTHQKLTMYQCHHGKNQQFEYNQINKTLHPIENKSLCVELPFKRNQKGKLTLKKCTYYSNQQFSIIDHRLKNYDDSQCIINSHGSLMMGKCINSTLAKFNFIPIVNKEITESEYIMLSDPQFPCVENCRVKDETTTANNLSLLFNLLNVNHRHANMLMVNGDMTESGFKYQVTHMKWLINGILTIPHAFGMGEHDYLNNLNHCVDNQCVIRSILWQVSDTQHNPNVIAHDVEIKKYYRFPYEYVDISGSLGYVIQDGNHLIMQLQDNYSGYQVDGFKDGVNVNEFVWPHGNSGKGKSATDIAWKKYRFNIKDNIKWVEAQLKKAKQDQQLVIVNKHRAHSTYEFNKLMADYDIKLKFAGHLPFNLGRSNGWYLSGTAALGNYLVVNIDDKTHTATIKGYQFEHEMFKDTILF